MDNYNPFINLTVLAGSMFPAGRAGKESKATFPVAAMIRDGTLSFRLPIVVCGLSY